MNWELKYSPHSLACRKIQTIQIVFDFITVVGSYSGTNPITCLTNVFEKILHRLPLSAVLHIDVGPILQDEELIVWNIEFVVKNNTFFSIVAPVSLLL